MDNLVLLCRHHHRLVHEGGFALRQSLAGEIYFSDPSGHDIPTCPEARSRGNVFSLFGAHKRSDIHITPQTTQSEWLGERMDDQLAVEGMLSLE